MSPILRISGEVQRKMWPYILQLAEKLEQKVGRENVSTLQIRLDIKKKLGIFKIAKLYSLYLIYFIISFIITIRII